MSFLQLAIEEHALCANESPNVVVDAINLIFVFLKISTVKATQIPYENYRPLSPEREQTFPLVV